MNRFLLDTHTILWLITDHPSLGMVARDLIIDLKNSILISIVTPWEIVIKTSLGKLIIAEAFDPYIAREIASNRFQILPTTPPHLSKVASLPHHHRDPFDRLLIAQAIVENMPILSADVAFDAYPVARLW